MGCKFVHRASEHPQQRPDGGSHAPHRERISKTKKDFGAPRESKRRSGVFTCHKISLLRRRSRTRRNTKQDKTGPLTRSRRQKPMKIFNKIFSLEVTTMVVAVALLPMTALGQDPIDIFSDMGIVAHPKMNAKAVENPGSPLRPAVDEPGSLLQTDNAVFAGECTPQTPFVFSLCGGSGRGVIGHDEAVSGISIAFQTGFPTAGAILEVTTADGSSGQESFFPLEIGAVGMMAMPFNFQDVPAAGLMTVVTCPVATNIMVTIQDDSPMDTLYMSKTAVAGGGMGTNSVMETFTLINGMDGSGPVQIDAFVNALSNVARRTKRALRSLMGNQNGNQNGNGNAFGFGMVNDGTTSEGSSSSSTNTNTMMTSSAEVLMVRSDSKSITIEHSMAGEVVLIQTTMMDSRGNTILRTFVTETRDLPPPMVDISMDSADIDENGDICITLAGFDSGMIFVDVTVRIGLELTGQPSFTEEVDTRAVVWGQDPVVKVHGGWIRSKLQSLGLSETDEGWDVVLIDAVVADPENGQRMMGRMASPGLPMNMKQNPRFTMLSDIPSIEEMNVSMDMRFGRKPEMNPVAPEGSVFTRRLLGEAREEGNRNLQQTTVQVDQDRHSKIIVHGYCDRGETIPVGDFSPVSRFTDPEQGFPLEPEPRNWSHLDFAYRLAYFQWAARISGCGVIGHSQGGMAALTMLETYWTCLDFADRGGGRLITSWGSPYQGSHVAGIVATLGELIGTGCGPNDDTTLSGSQTWLNTIGNTARSRVHYYRTSFEDRFFRIDQCHVMTDLFLPDPDDGIVSENNGVLPGGNNRGTTEGECHSDYHRDPSQTRNAGRNNEIDNNLRY